MEKKNIKKNHNWCECQRSYRICPLMGDWKITAKTNGDNNMLTLPKSPCWVVGSTGWGALVAEGLEAGTACGTVCITMDPCGLMICCPGADTICRTLPKSTKNATNISVKNDILILTPTPYQLHARSLNVFIALCLTSLIQFITVCPENKFNKRFIL